MALATVDLSGVEILSVGGPVHGAGSPPEGDHWAAKDLRAMADAAAALGGELRAPAKIGHSDKQAFAKSGLTDGEMPAAGWLDNIRVNVDGSKLLADIRNVPTKLADLINAGAYRTRSVELSRVTSQKTGKTYDWAVTGLAWLGGKLPAVQTLDDWAKLYESDESEPQFVQLDESAPDVEALRDAVASLGETLLNETNLEIRAGAESRHVEVTLTDEQAVEVRTTLGLDADAEITAESLVEASTARANELAVKDAKIAELETRKNEASTLEQTVRKLEADVKVEQTRRFELERETDLTAAVRAGKIDPAQLDDWQKDYDDNQAGTRRILERLKSDPDLVREFGRDAGEDTGEQSDEEYQRDFERRHGMKASV